MSISVPSVIEEKVTDKSRHAQAFRRIGILNDYVKIPYANGSSFASQFLYREFRARGHQVTVVGPHDPKAKPEELPEHHVGLRALPMRNHPGVLLPFPSQRALAKMAAQRFDILLGQAGSELVEAGVWLRAMHHVPFLCVNTLHLRSAYNVVLPDALLKRPAIRKVFEGGVIPWIEGHAAEVYNQCDGLVVLASGLERFWRERGVTIPIHVIPRSVEPKIFDATAGDDPFDPRAVRGGRVLVVCRHTREKNVTRLLEIFARHILPRCPTASLTLVGDGPDHDTFRAQAEKLGIAEQCFFPGEFPVTEMPRFYRHADLFVYTSLSETYGQVVSEAMWCGLPVVALDDDMGVADQVTHGLTGYLVKPGPDEAAADARFGAYACELLSDPHMRRALGEQARSSTRLRAHPRRVMSRYYDAFEQSQAQCAATLDNRLSRPMAPWVTLSRWASVQAVAVGLGYIRPPAVVNRHGRGQPAWNAL
jgi:glycosyltransferase involved in cell wall biosynthesis